MTIEDWIEGAKIAYDKLADGVLSVDNFGVVVEVANDPTFVGDLCLNVSDADVERALAHNATHFVYEFGGAYYVTALDECDGSVDLKIFRHVGVSKTACKHLDFVHLGVHGSFELMNGSRLYRDWIDKAKFLGCLSLGICEHGTLAGVMQFQIDCADAGVKPTLGVTYDFLVGASARRAKLFAATLEGWQNILALNKKLLVDFKKLTIDDLFERCAGCVVVLSDQFIDVFESDALPDAWFYQLDTAELDSGMADLERLERLKKVFASEQPLALINDSYYLDKDDAQIKKLLNRLDNVTREPMSDDRYFKSLDESYESFASLFDDGTVWRNIFERAVQGASDIAIVCDFKIEIGIRRLPDFKLNMLPSVYAKVKSPKKLFDMLLLEGFESKIERRKIYADIEAYRERLKEEVRVIEMGNLVSYFLIIWDVNRWCRDNNIFYGVGRGSVGGSLVAYLLGVTNLDPIKYNLLFERFLNENRAKKSLPDIDSDYEGLRRDDIKAYMIKKYGADYFASVGTYSTMKVKLAMKDIGRALGVPAQTVNFITSELDHEYRDDAGKRWSEIFEVACRNARVKQFVKQFPEVINNMRLCMGQHRSASVHASATIIVPDDKTIFEVMPVKKVDGSIVTEWEGIPLDSAGFLKEDILGIAQLDKFRAIVELIRRTTGEEIDLYEIPLDDEKTFKLFQGGNNEDVFQFGTPGMKKFSRDLLPETIDHLVAMNALYRPGAMQSNAHHDYAAIKNGFKEPEYDYGLRDVTEDTYGLYLYQEQTMLAAQKLAGFTLTEADDLRKNMLGRGKKQHLDKLGPLKDKFFTNAVANGCPEEDVSVIWDKLEAFAGYGFNKCLAGYEKLKRLGKTNFGHANYHPTIAEMYRIKNDKQYAIDTGHLALWKKYQTSYGVSYSMNGDRRLIKNKIVDIRYEGLRAVYRIILESGRYVDVTLNHKFPTSDGDKELRNLKSGDKLFVNAGYEGHQKKLIKKIATNLPQKGQIGFQKTGDDTCAKKFIKNREYLKRTIVKCQDCGKSHRRLELHHMSMLQKGLLTTLETIAGIVIIGEIDVYDVEMAAPFHNFVTSQDIVTCNSHAAAYAITAYYSQWFKANYPVQFWTVSLQFAEKHIYSRIAEMRRVNPDILLMPPDVNVSATLFVCDTKARSIYWSLNSVKYCGESALPKIFDERANGEFFSLSEFVDRTTKKRTKAEQVDGDKSSSVNAQAVEHLIYAGAFDAVSGIAEPKHRLELLVELAKLKKRKDYSPPVDKPWWWWVVKQKEVCGYGHIDYKRMLSDAGMHRMSNSYVDGNSLASEPDMKAVTIVGIIEESWSRPYKKGEYGKLLINSNDVAVDVVIWSDIWDVVRDDAQVGRMVAFRGVYKSARQSVSSNDGSKLVVLWKPDDNL